MDNGEKSTNYPSWFALLPRLWKKKRVAINKCPAPQFGDELKKMPNMGRTFGAGIGPSPKSDESVLAKKTTIEMFQKMVDLLLGFIPLQLQYVST